MLLICMGEIMIDIIKEYIENGNIISKLGNISSICMEDLDDLNWWGLLF